MQTHKKIFRFFAIASLLGALASFCAGCGRYAVRPDEKEFLADRIMQPDFDAQETAADQHVLSNREGSEGGFGAVGGGCGCN
jgi:Domain of unknown function (DUF4266)